MCSRPGRGRDRPDTLLRDWLRANDAYLQVKRDLARRTWRHVQHYADSKSTVVEQIMACACASVNLAAAPLLLMSAQGGNQRIETLSLRG